MVAPAHLDENGEWAVYGKNWAMVGAGAADLKQKTLDTVGGEEYGQSEK